MELKHQDLFVELDIIDLYPPDNLNPVETVAYRWVSTPIENEVNFLPNYLFDKLKNNVERYSNGRYSKEDLVKRCSQSFFNNLHSAKVNHKKIPKGMRDKLGYTHIAEGEMNKEDGFATETNAIGHFGFYECYLCDLKLKFKICDSLN